MNLIHKPILFVDFDGTLCHDRFWRSLGQNKQSEIQEYLFGKNKEIVNQWMLGGYTSEEINILLAEKLKVSPEWLWKIFVEDCRSMTVSLQTLIDLASLRNRFELVLLTDNMDCFSRFTVPALNLGYYFDKIINSYSKKRSKKDLLPDLVVGKPITRSFIIDDSPEVCTLFEKLGGNACLVTTQQNTTHHIASIKITLDN